MYKLRDYQSISVVKGLEILNSDKARRELLVLPTGAGKSILMGALSLILGDRADTKSLLNEQDKCVIEGTFDISTYKLKSYFETNELDYETTCLLRREIAPSGKSRAFINDTPVNLSELQLLAENLIDIHSQHQTRELEQQNYQISILDSLDMAIIQLLIKAP